MIAPRPIFIMIAPLTHGRTTLACSNLSLAIGVLKDLEARRDGEADGSAGERRLEAALEAVLARYVPWKEGDDVEIYDASVANTDPREGGWKSGKLGLPNKAEYGWYYVRRGDDEADQARPAD